MQPRFSGQLLPHQLDFVSDVNTPQLALVAGYGSGKSQSIAVKMIHLASLNVGYTGVVVEPSFPMIEEPLLPLVFDALEVYGIPYSFKRSPNPTLVMHFADGDSTVLFKSAEQMDKLRGINAAFVIIDEIDTLPQNKAKQLWQILQGRVRLGNVLQICCASTPEGYAFMYEHFGNIPPEKAHERRLIRARTYDNPFLPKSYIDNLLSSYPEQLITAYLNGEFVNLATGNVYYAFDRVLNNTDKTLADFNEPGRILHIGVDFNVNNTSATVTVVQDKIIYVVDELSGIFNTEALIKELRAKYPGRKMRVYPDSSGDSEKTNASVTDIILLKNAGLNPHFHTKNPPVRERVGSVNAKLKNGKGERTMFVNVNKCPNLVKGLEQQGFDAQGKPDKTKGLDHQLDSLGYTVYYNFPITDKPVATIIY